MKKEDIFALFLLLNCLYLQEKLILVSSQFMVVLKYDF